MRTSIAREVAGARWSVTTNFANEVSKNLRGVAFPPTGILNTTDWYYVK